MSWSTCGWTLLSHNSPICVIASCVVPCQRPLRSPLWSNLSACVHDSQPHPGCWWYHAQTRSRRTSDFGNHADSQQVCYLRLSACWCYWLIYALGLCSRWMRAQLKCLTHDKLVSDLNPTSGSVCSLPEPVNRQCTTSSTLHQVWRIDDLRQSSIKIIAENLLIA